MSDRFLAATGEGTCLFVHWNNVPLSKHYNVCRHFFQRVAEIFEGYYHNGFHLARKYARISVLGITSRCMFRVSNMRKHSILWYNALSCYFWQWRKFARGANCVKHCNMASLYSFVWQLLFSAFSWGAATVKVWINVIQQMRIYYSY